MNNRRQDTPSPLEQKILTLVQVYKVVTADQVAESLHITWDEAYDALVRLQLVFSAVTIHPRKPVTEFHIIQRGG